MNDIEKNPGPQHDHDRCNREDTLWTKSMVIEEVKETEGGLESLLLQKYEMLENMHLHENAKKTKTKERRRKRSAKMCKTDK